MKPMYSDEDRYAIVNRFINARGQGKAIIQDFKPITKYLNDGSIKLLHKIKRTGTIIKKGNYAFTIDVVEKALYSNDDAQEYFNWLISMVSGAEKVAEGIIKESVDQLFLFIFALRDKMSLNPDVLLIAPVDWEYRLKSLEGKHSTLERRTDARNEKAIDALEKIVKWQKTYQPSLDRLETDYKKKGVLPSKKRKEN